MNEDKIGLSKFDKITSTLHKVFCETLIIILSE